jgi:hypothetical protein
MENMTRILGSFSRWLYTIAVGTVIMAGLGGCNTLQSIEISSEPTRKVYGQGQELSQSGLVVTGHFKKDSREITNQVTVSGYNKDRPGEQTVTVTMNGQSAIFTVTVAPVEKLTIAQPPSTTVFLQGDNFNPAGLSVLAEFEGGKVPAETLAPGRLTLSGYDGNKAGVQTLTADYYGKRVSFEVQVAALSRITVASPPDKTDYFTGEDLDLAGIVVMGTWEGAGEKPVSVTKENLSSFDQNRAGEQDAVVTYQGKTANFPVTFTAMQSIAVSRPPEKLNYENGEELDLSGLTVQGTRTGATSIEMVDIERLKISGYDRFQGGNQTVTLTIGGRSATFRVTVAPNPFVGAWQGAYVRTFAGETFRRAALLTMKEDSWTILLEESSDFGAPQEEYSGTYTRDSNKGRSVELLLTSSGRDRRTPPTGAYISSEDGRRLQVTGGAFGGEWSGFGRQ